MVRVAEAKVARVRAAHGAVGELGRWVWEDRVPPLEELGRVALGRDRVVACAVAGGD